MSIEESILAEDLGKGKSNIDSEENIENPQKSITHCAEKAISKASPSEDEEGSTISLCKGDRPSKNTVLAPKQTDGHTTHSQSLLRKHKSPNRLCERLRSSSKKRVRSQSKSPARKSEAQTNLEKSRELADSKGLKKPRNVKLQESQNDMNSSRKKGKNMDDGNSDELLKSEKPLGRSLIRIRSSLTPGELETVRRIPSDTFAACHAAFMHSAPDEAENEDTVLLPLQAEASFHDDWLIDSVTSIMKARPMSCLLSETIEERVASASGLSARCGSICRLLPQDTCGAAAAAAAEAGAQTERRRSLQRQPRSASSSSSSSSSGSASECESVGSASSRGGGGRAQSGKRGRGQLDRPPTPVGAPLSQRMASAHSRRSVLQPAALDEGNEEL